jgi:hypothetical protein
MRELLAPAMERPSAMVLAEDYYLIVVDSFTAPFTDERQLDEVDLVTLLSGSVRPLSARAREELLSNRFSYYADECVVITRDRAFIHQPGGSAGMLDVLEAANAQLLELRYYDALLDDELPRMYDLVARARHVPRMSAPRRLSDLARGLYTLVAEVTELTERVDNALQILGNTYLTQVYIATLRQFGVPSLGKAVDRKLAIIRDTYAALYDEASASRADILEIAIIALIVLEIVLALVRL